MVDIFDFRWDGFTYFRSTKAAQILPTKFRVPAFVLIGLTVQEKIKIGFKDVRHCGYPGFPVGMILANFDL